MTAVAASISTVSESPILEGITWPTYQTVLRELESAGKHLRVTYDRGRMVILSPLPIHEKWKQLIGRLIEVLAEERNMPISAYGSTTWQREDLARGLEADQCYYIQHANAMRGKIEIDLQLDPPPDLAIEIEVTHHLLDRADIYAALRVPELWRYDGHIVRTFRLTGENYVETMESIAFPGFRSADLQQFLAMHPASLDSEIIRAFRQWLGQQ
jgi:Uma2 family endonuclease